MEGIYDFLAETFGDSSVLMLALLVFLATATLTFGVMVALRTRGAVKRRAAVITSDLDESAATEGSSLRNSSLQAVARVLEYTAKHYSAADSADMKVLRRRLVQAGIYDSRAVGYFFIARTGLAIMLAVVMFFGLPFLMSLSGMMFWLFVMAGGIFGYVAPSMFLDKRIRKRREEHRAGFPDFMDLLVVCADSGLAMEAALERIGRELAESYPSLCSNIHMTNLEIRAGRSLAEALEHFADRLSLEEAQSFATLIQQSLELGSNISDALRVYSDDMRHKRLSRAEEKAYSLPAKLSLPMMVCIFPVIFVVILLPVFVRLWVGNF